ncbi:AbrB family transcriptional regulator [Cohnella sp. 56]|uniref:AbrB family transcriptional regulator n=1 Tax=Cohnella sp. 56 TaxID=3113722 RepID=UPI0030E770A5
MTGWLSAPLTFAVALAGGWAARRLRLPAGALVGGMVAVSAMQLLSGTAYVPVLSRPVLQIAGGALLGHAIGRADLVNLRAMIRPALLLILGLIAVNLGLGYLLHALCGMNLTTALFASAPGGVSDMALIIEELKGDTTTVSILQVFRLFGIYLLYPPLFRLLSARARRQRPERAGIPAGAAPAAASVPMRAAVARIALTADAADAAAHETAAARAPQPAMPGGEAPVAAADIAARAPMPAMPGGEAPVAAADIAARAPMPAMPGGEAPVASVDIAACTPMTAVPGGSAPTAAAAEPSLPAAPGRAANRSRFLQTMAASILGGLAFIALGVPAGGMVGGVLCAAWFNARTGRGYVPKQFGFVLQAGVGALIGANMTRAHLASIHELVVPIVLQLAFLLCFTALLGWLMSRWTRLDPLTSLLAITPGGIQEISMIARELGCDPVPVIVMHTVRLVAVICIFPSLLHFVIA